MIKCNILFSLKKSFASNCTSLSFRPFQTYKNFIDFFGLRSLDFFFYGSSLDQMNGATQIDMYWTPMSQFHWNLNIHSNLFCRLKCVGSRYLFCFFLCFIKMNIHVLFMCFTLLCVARPNMWSTCFFYSCVIQSYIPKRHLNEKKGWCRHLI
jgi:hypothetical protein